MTPPDTDIEKQQRRHRAPLWGMAIVAILAIGLIVFWIAGLFVTAPGPNPEEPAAVTSDDVRSGDVEVLPSAPVEEVAPGDEEVEIEQ